MVQFYCGFAFSSAYSIVKQSLPVISLSSGRMLLLLLLRSSGRWLLLLGPSGSHCSFIGRMSNSIRPRNTWLSMVSAFQQLILHNVAAVLPMGKWKCSLQVGEDVCWMVLVLNFSFPYSTVTRRSWLLQVEKKKIKGERPRTVIVTNSCCENVHTLEVPFLG